MIFIIKTFVGKYNNWYLNIKKKKKTYLFIFVFIYLEVRGRVTDTHIFSELHAKLVFSV